jgi:hypothetical protein
MIIVSDTSCISNLQIIDKLELLQSIYGELVIPEGVYKELLELKKFYPSLEKIDNYSWIEVRKVQDTLFVDKLKLELDQGESEAIALAKELSADALVIDEIIGRKVALQYGISVIGILGVLILAKRKNLILSVKILLDELKKKAGFWVGDDIYSLILKKVDEYP